MKTAWAPFVVMTVAACATLAALLRDPPLKLLWNITASAPVGLYWVARPQPLRRGDLVVVSPANALAIFLAERDYLPLGAPLIKPLAALPGQQICRAGAVVRIDGVLVAQARRRDRRGRDLPTWQGCRTLVQGQVFLLNPAREDSLDGRYFGELPTASVVGRAMPLWVWPRPQLHSAPPLSGR